MGTGVEEGAGGEVRKRLKRCIDRAGMAIMRGTEREREGEAGRRRERPSKEPKRMGDGGRRR